MANSKITADGDCSHQIKRRLLLGRKVMTNLDSIFKSRDITLLYTWTSPDRQHRNQIVYILCSQRWRSSIQSAKTRPEADCWSDHELLIAKLRLKLKKVGKTTRPFSYDLNQIPYDFTVEMTNRFKGFNLIDRVPEELWMKVCNIA